MRVLFTHELFPPDMRGGGELIAYEAAKALRVLGVDVRVLTTGAPEIKEFGGIATLRLPMSRYRMNLATGPVHRSAASVDVLQTFNYHACLPTLAAARRLRKPVACVVLGFFGDAWLSMKGPVLGRAWRAFERRQLGAPFDATVFISDYSLEQARQAGIRPPNPLVLCPGIEQERFAPAAKDGPVVFNGKFDGRKGVFEVLEVARALPEIDFVLYGWGPEENALRRSAPRNARIVAYSDYTARELPGLLAHAPVCLLPSKAETFGLALVQAMASGCAIVSSIPLEFAGHRTGAGDVPAMAEAVRDLWSRREEAAAMGARNVTLAREYTWERFAKGLLNIYESALRVRDRS